MLKSVFLAPGRIAANSAKDKKRHYRSVRNKTPGGPGVVLVSLAFWLLLAFGILVAVDKSGLLKEVLDAGVTAAQTAGSAQTEAGGEEGAPDAPPADEATAQPADASGTLSGNISTSPGAADPAAAVESERWLVILHTIPKTAREEAERRQKQYINQGLSVEIMDTDAFPRLLGGNWIIAQGPFDNRDQALEAANKAKEFNSNLMVRRGL